MVVTKREAQKRYCAYRGRSLAEAVGTHGAYADPDGPMELLEAVLADARHLADLHGLDFGRVDKEAHQVYLRDLAGD